MRPRAHTPKHLRSIALLASASVLLSACDVQFNTDAAGTPSTTGEIE